MLHRILKKTTKCFTCEKYGQSHVKCVINPIKARKLKVNKINKKKNKILLKKCLEVKWLVKAIKIFNFSTIYRRYENFIKRTSNVAKKDDERKTESKK